MKDEFPKLTIDDFGTKIWRDEDGQLHRTDGPAVEHPDGYKSWHINGKLHREDGPAVEQIDGHKEWHLNGKLHREDGPAIEWSDGSKSWWINGLLHREDEPAVEHVGGEKQWWINGKQHRTDGPAVEHPDGSKEWWFNGRKTTESEFNENNEWEDRNHVLYESMVPDSGHCETLEGEMLRAINRIVHRHYNDGDKWYSRYGIETAGPAMSFLTSRHIPDSLRKKLSTLMGQSEHVTDRNYQIAIFEMLKCVVEYVESKNGEYTESSLDMQDFGTKYCFSLEDDLEDDYY